MDTLEIYKLELQQGEHHDAESTNARALLDVPPVLGGGMPPWSTVAAWYLVAVSMMERIGNFLGLLFAHITSACTSWLNVVVVEIVAGATALGHLYR